MFTLTGSESVDGAMKLARAGHRAERRRRQNDLPRPAHYAYDGDDGRHLDQRPAAEPAALFGPLLPDCDQVERDCSTRCASPWPTTAPERIAAIITEPVQGAGGVFPPPPGDLQGLRADLRRIRRAAAFDEVITGFGRLGSWFGAHHYGVAPDLMTFAKGVTSGYLPLGRVSS